MKGPGIDHANAKSVAASAPNCGINCLPPKHQAFMIEAAKSYLEVLISSLNQSTAQVELEKAEALTNYGIGFCRKNHRRV